jgi:hypothetical protein
MHTGSQWGNLKERVHFEVLGVDNTKMRLKQIGLDGADWTEGSQGEDK